MECYYCKGSLVRSTSSYYVKRDNYHLIESVPAWICEQCGEPSFEEREVQTIREIIEDMDQKIDVLAKAA
jgi:YgiT-type zinc finger domain-containing protein